MTANISIKVGPLEVIPPQQMFLPLCSPLAGTGTRVHSHGAVRCDGLQVYVWASTLEAILAHGRSDPTHEVGGWLFGRYGSDGVHPLVLVEETLRAKGGGRSMVSFRFTVEDQEAVATFREHSDLLTVGWYHSHPLGLALSDQDKDVHRIVFRQPFHVVLVMGIGGRDIGCAVWDHGQISDVGGFFVLDKRPA